MTPVPYCEDDAWSMELFDVRTGEIYEGEFVDMRLLMETIPEGMFAYNCRHADDGDWIDPVTIEKGEVGVNFSGVFITESEITFPEGEDYISVTQYPLSVDFYKWLDYSDNSCDFYDLPGFPELDELEELSETAAFDCSEEVKFTDLLGLIDTKSDYFLNKYLNDLKAIAPVTKDEEAELFSLLAEKSTKARCRLVTMRLPLVASIAAEFNSYTPNYTAIIKTGNTGLIWAAVKFDCSKDYTFTQVASWWIRRMIEKKLRIRSHN